MLDWDGVFARIEFLSSMGSGLRPLPVEVQGLNESQLDGGLERSTGRLRVASGLISEGYLRVRMWLEEPSWNP